MKEKAMKTTIRTFGVDSSDVYWQQRKDIGRVNERRLHRFLCNLVDETAPREGGKVLDCGMGAGHVFRGCMERHETFGVEISSEAIKMYDFPTDNVRQVDLNDGLPDFGTGFDVIVCSMILHWLDEPVAFLEQARNALTNNGKLIIVVPNITYYRFRLAYLFGRFPPISLSHKNFQVPSEVEQMFQEAGLVVEKRMSPRKSIRAKLRPTLFSADIVYLLKPI